jgi:hypothetical protein
VTLFDYQTKRRRRDSNPRISRSAVFKTAAFDHSATPPGAVPQYYEKQGGSIGIEPPL